MSILDQITFQSGKNNIHMKETGILWIFSIPEEWNVRKLKSLVSCLDSKRIPVDSNLRVSGDYPYWGAGNIVDHVDQYIFDDELILLGEDGAPFFDKKRPVAFYSNEKIWVNNHIHVLKAHDHISAKFLVYSLNAVDYHECISGSILPKLTQTDMNNISIPVPDYTTQVNIAKYLDDVCNFINPQITSIEDIIEKLEELKQSLLNDVMIRGFYSPSQLVDSNIDWIDKTPSHWKQYRLKNVLEESDVRSTEGLEEPLSMSQKLGLVKSSKLNVPNPPLSYVNYKLVSPGQIVFNKLKAHLGVFAISNSSGLVSPDYAVYSVKDGFLPEFLVYLFKTTSCIQEFKKYISGVAIGLMRLYTDDLFNIRVSIPPIEEQCKIVNYMGTKITAIDGLIDNLESKIESLNELKSSLIYEYVTGKKQVPREVLS